MRYRSTYLPPVFVHGELYRKRGEVFNVDLQSWSYVPSKGWYQHRTLCTIAEWMSSIRMITCIYVHMWQMADEFNLSHKILTLLTGKIPMPSFSRLRMFSICYLAESELQGRDLEDLSACNKPRVHVLLDNLSNHDTSANELFGGNVAIRFLVRLVKAGVHTTHQCVQCQSLFVLTLRLVQFCNNLDNFLNWTNLLLNILDITLNSSRLIATKSAVWYIRTKRVM